MVRFISRLRIYFALSLALGLVVEPDLALAANLSANVGKVKQETIQAVQNRLSPLLLQYCRDACNIVDIKVETDEQLTESDDIGFEGVNGESAVQNPIVSKVFIEVQVDDRVSNVNRERLGTILGHHLQNLGGVIEIIWKPVTIPQIGQSAAKEEQLKRQLQLRIESVLDKVIDSYCPEQCLISNVSVDGKLVTPDEAANASPEELVRDKTGQGVLKIDGVDIIVSLDSRLSQATRKKIVSVMKAKTKFASPLNFDIQTTEFPESFTSIEEKKRSESRDPFGLEKLRQTLKIFKELAGTKELITTSSQKSEQATSNSNDNLTTGGETSLTQDLIKYGALFLGLILVVGAIFFGVRISAANRDAKLMMQHMPSDSTNTQKEAQEQKGITADEKRELAFRIGNETVREDLMKLFFDAPRVARETFTRLIQEEGIEETARYVHIFGHVIVFELLGDPNLQRDLHDLSEFYHKSSFNFTQEEIHQLLASLKVRVTANEIRVLTRKQLDKFDFLQKLDANQIYSLIIDERPQVQSIVLTQLDQKRRRSVFEMYFGQVKIDLMKELCRAESIPTEYLSNVAKALQKKVSRSPEYDAANLRSSDLLYDLLEKADLAEQRSLMDSLAETNPEAARAIKIKLVTVEMLPYLKDGHLLEIILGLEREDLLVFLSGCKDHIRNLIMAKAPDELSEGWNEDLANVRRLDEQGFRIIELKVLNRLRQLAANGFINLLDINDMIFSVNKRQSTQAGEKEILVESQSAMVA